MTIARRTFLSAGLGGAIAVCSGTPIPALAAIGSAYRLSGPYVHKNLAIFLIHRSGGSGKTVPLTLKEAMEAGVIQVLETGTVSRLIVRNPGDREVFIQAGDIVKGGKQDRVLAVSMVVPPNSGNVPIDAYCVEQGRWSKRGGESVADFSVSTALVPSSDSILALMAPSMALSGRRVDTVRAQARMWASVLETQKKLGRTINRDVADRRSRSSLQLTLENDAVGAAVSGFETALGGLADKHPDAVGYVAAIGGTIDRGDEFESAALFGKLWRRQLRAVSTEALARLSARPAALPTPEAVAAFIDRARAAGTSLRKMPGGLRVITGWTERSAYAETVRDGGRWLHRRFIRKR